MVMEPTVGQGLPVADLEGGHTQQVQMLMGIVSHVDTCTMALAHALLLPAPVQIVGGLVTSCPSVEPIPIHQVGVADMTMVDLGVAMEDAPDTTIFPLLTPLRTMSIMVRRMTQTQMIATTLRTAGRSWRILRPEHKVQGLVDLWWTSDRKFQSL